MNKPQIPNPKFQKADLREKLVEDTGSTEAADELLSTTRRLQDWRAPQPSAQDTAKLLATLRPAMPRRPSAIRHWLSAMHNVWPVLLLRSQFRVVRSEIWTASGVVMLLGTLVTLALRQPLADGTLPFVLLAPLVAAVGVAFIYGPGVDPALEIELALPVSPRVVLLTRLVLVFGFDLALGGLGSAVLAVFRADLSLWPLVQAWLAPMAFLSALALFLTTLNFDPLVGVVVSMIVWGYQTLRVISAATPAIPLFRLLPDLLAADMRLWLAALALALVVATFWLTGREERWVRSLATQ